MPKQSPAYQKVNPRERKFVKEYVKHGNLGEAVKESYNPKTKQSASSMGSQIIKRPRVQRAIIEAMQEQNITPDWLLSKKKTLINQGMRQLPNQRVSPETLNKTLDSMFKLYATAGVSIQHNSQLHLHLHEKTRGEVLAKRNEYSDYFNEILDGETVKDK
jgi:hypothetical protein